MESINEWYVETMVLSGIRFLWPILLILRHHLPLSVVRLMVMRPGSGGILKIRPTDASRIRMVLPTVTLASAGDFSHLSLVQSAEACETHPSVVVTRCHIEPHYTLI